MCMHCCQIDILLKSQSRQGTTGAAAKGRGKGNGAASSFLQSAGCEEVRSTKPFRRDSVGVPLGFRLLIWAVSFRSCWWFRRAGNKLEGWTRRLSTIPFLLEVHREQARRSPPASNPVLVPSVFPGSKAENTDAWKVPFI
ncbi:hypothetical protein KFL_000840030 [Klebsormidium nitens]|uniref:Uncharacterized protein n=1 Tax=Klebsormidium nitens TaxID=105231 RepID=A0A1Y1HSF3_KLENI|nr:hypothetical protein KFL_000840030 [Klebsormidium nitens]|eukprot:GAQ81560.1 hypothetical protein KFL_000840030 [Klebsormidium nitens]